MTLQINQMIRKILSILFAGLILFNLSGYYFVFKCDQICIKCEMKGMISNGSFRDHNVDVFLINPATDRDFKILDKDEIWYQGKMYDVISTKISGILLFSGVSMIPKKNNCLPVTKNIPPGSPA